MRKLLAAVIVAAALVGVGWLGTSLVAPYEPPPVAQAASNSAEKRKAPKPALGKKTWAEKASTSCAQALEDNRAVIRDSPFTTADEHSELEAFLTLGKTLNWVEARLIRELKSVRPPVADRRRVSETLALLVEEHRHLVATMASVQTMSDQEYVEAIRLDERMAAELRVLFLGLGATSCAAFFDPESY